VWNVPEHRTDDWGDCPSNAPRISVAQQMYVSAWHEQFGTTSQTITIGANETKELSFLFKSM
jgi:hypothetical protein